ncbi:bifunctional metallophosphatase/5'-nucleotidase [Sporolactobacillus pectinivorans]|uniref:bifunctional metallophosphatase/5'-nucleotidase n=1 Tax=Sporolactobacillus pectinivorans TaxID=1591408 RepID=UPI000C25A49E|nr:bifunctional UDP-sugar hydrolase/5'-nucleotidase [Sporolactobacillus pectinivorans]
MDTMKLVILETSDVHGSIYPINYADNSYREVGVGKVATLIRRERAACPDCLLVDNGDMIQGTPLLYYYARFDQRRPNPMAVLDNRLGYDCAVFGNHEFNFGREATEHAVHDSKFPWLAANILNTKTGKPYFGKPYIIKTYEPGFRVAVLGLITKYIPIWEKPENITGMYFADPVETAKEWVPYLKGKERADIVVISYHGGFERDLETGEPTEMLTGENQGYQLCMEVSDLDVLLSGHQHRRISGAEIHGVTVVQPGCNGAYLGKVTLDLKKDGVHWTVSGKKSELLPVNGIVEDRELLKLTDHYEKDAQDWLDRPLGRIDGDMLVRDPMEVRMQEHPLIEFINRMQMKASGVDISLTALFNNESPGLPVNVSMRDIVSNYIYPNTLKVIRISGGDMLEALERSASFFKRYTGGPVEVSDTFTTPKPQYYNYDMWEGINYMIDLSKPVGSRIIKLEYHGDPVAMDGQYDVVMNNYRSSGGGDYLMFRNKPVVKDVPVDVTEIMANEIIEKKVIKAEVNNNWKLIC